MLLDKHNATNIRGYRNRNAREAPLPHYPDINNKDAREDSDTASIRIFYPSTISSSVPTSSQTLPISCSLLTPLFHKKPPRTIPLHSSHLTYPFFIDRNTNDVLWAEETALVALQALPDAATLRASDADSQLFFGTTVLVFASASASVSEHVDFFIFSQPPHTAYSNTSPTHISTVCRWEYWR